MSRGYWHDSNRTSHVARATVLPGHIALHGSISQRCGEGFCVCGDLLRPLRPRPLNVG